jgi:hypothetical protein
MIIKILKQILLLTVYIGFCLSLDQGIKNE